MKINDILRASGVTRWHIVRTVRPQSLAEHTFDVTMIARAIAKIAGYEDYEITKAALLHDLDEIVTGDIPTPTKEKARDNGWELNDLYKSITGRELSGDETLIIQLADKMADLHWLWLHALGPHANRVYEIMADNFNNYVRSESIPDNIREATLEVQVQMLSEEFTL
ncbi:MAG: YfbR-like 5'-deoxynucleotidase [Candidatus Thorarchaeota archaeon]|jgi:5'-deoxynucleotidase YfbR-like HD superfamily hydrolase